MMSVKKMVELYVSYDLNEDTWHMMWEMSVHGLISRDNWTKFFEKCKGWTMSEDGQTILDEREHVIYKRDVNGFLIKVA